MATSFPRIWAQTMVNASGWVGLTFPGMIELPGSFSGMMISPIPLRGPELNIRMSFAILKQLIAARLSAPCNSTIASWAAKASNLFGAVTNGNAVSSAMYLATSSEYPAGVFNPVPTAVPPNANSAAVGKARLIAFTPFSNCCT